jgi:tRNA(Ile)-lysidine synthase
MIFTMSLFNTLEDLCRKHGVEKNYWIAYSGGLDSHVLLHLFVNLRSLHAFNLHVVHVNHGLSPNATAWAKHCEAVCDALNVRLTQRTIDARPIVGESPEDTARQGRYAVFSELLGDNDVLLTAHHQDDQAETVLLQLFRGAGPKGLAAMPDCKSLGKGLHLRPLLNHARTDLELYAKQNQLIWIEDESNQNTHFARNFIRHDILSALKSRWPSMTNTLARVAANCAEAQQMLDTLALEDLMNVKGSVDDTLSVKKLVQLTPDRQRQIFRYWLTQLNFLVPGAKKLQQIQHDILHAGIDRLPHVAWKGVELRRYRDNIYALPRLSFHDATQVFDWHLQETLQLPGIGELHAKAVQGDGLRVDLGPVSIRFRQGGESCHLPGRDCHHDLRKLMQTWDVPTWQRDRIPLVFVGKKLVAAIGYFIDSDFVATENQTGYQMTFLQAKKK